MSKFSSVPAFNVGRLNNAECVFFLDMLQKYIDEVGFAILGLKEADYLAFKAIVENLKSIMNTTHASDETEKLHVSDDLRDDICTCLFGMLKYAVKHPIKTKKEAATYLNLIIKPFIGVQSQALNQENQSIQTLCEQLSETEATASINRLGLNDVLQELQKANLECIEHYSNRMEGRVSTACKPLRVDATLLYDKIVAMTNASMLLNPTPELDGFVQKFNSLIKDTQTAYNQRMAQIHSHKKDDDTIQEVTTIDKNVN